MERSELVAAGAREVAAFCEAARGIPPHRPVRSCPGWSVKDLTAHVWTFVNSMVTGEWNETPPLAGDALLDDLATTHAALIHRWSTEERPRGARRLAHEVSIHRWDAQDASDRATPIDAAVAADGIDEIFRVFIANPAFGDGGKGDRQVIRIEPVDDPTTFVAEFTPDGLRIGDTDRPADLTLTAPASDLQLFLWGRLPASAINWTGQETIVRRLESPRFH